MAMAWIQLLLFSLLSFTPLCTLSRSVPEGDINDVDDDDGDNENICRSICEGIDGDLSRCRMKLSEKTDYSLNIEKDLFAVKEQLRMTNLLCINSSQVSSVQIAALMNQLNSMLKQLEEKADQGPSQLISKVLQEYVKAQKLELELLAARDPEKVRELQEQLKKSRAELEALLGNLNEIDCETASSSQNAISELLGRNHYLEEKITDTLAECNDLQDNYINLQEEFDSTEEKYSKLEQNYRNVLNTVNELRGKPDSKLKLILEILLLIQQIQNLENRIRSESSESERKQLEDELNEKKKQLESKKKESNDPDLKTVLIIIWKLEDLWRFQSKEGDLNRLDQINDKKQEVLRLISALDDSNLAKSVLTTLVLMSDETHLRKQITDLKQQADTQIAGLQEEVRMVEKELKKKIAELQQNEDDMAALNNEIHKLQEELRNFKKQLKDLNTTSVLQLTELQKKLEEKNQEVEKWNSSLQEKESELLKNVMKNTELLKQLRETKHEAGRRNRESAEKITDLEEKLKKENSETKRLQEELKKATECNDLKTSYSKLKADFKDTIWKLNDTLITQVFTINALKQEVQRLEDKIRSSEGNVDELTSTLREKKAELVEARKAIKKWRRESLRLLDLLEELRNVNRKQDEHIQDYLATINRLEKELENLLTRLSASGNEKATLSIQVIFLHEEVSKLNKDVARLKEEHREKIAGLEEEIKEKNKEIVYLKRSGCGTEQLKNQISGLQQELREKQRELEELRIDNAAQIRELQKQLSDKKRKLEETREKLQSDNAELVNRLTELNAQLNRITEDRKEDIAEAHTRISALEKQLEKQEQECSAQELRNAELQKQLKQKEEELSNLNNNNKDVKQENERLRDLLNERVKTSENLKDQLEQKEKETSDLKDRNADLINENKHLSGDVKTLNNRVKVLERSEEQKEKHISELMKKNAKLTDETQKLQGDATKLKQRIDELEKTELRVTVKPPSGNIKYLQFDPNTAHRSLQIANGVSVRGVPFSINRPDNPQRYDTVFGAVTTAGFSTGRSYWEVKVIARECFTIGVASKYAPRKGYIKYEPRNGYWVIQKQKNGQYFMLTEHPLLLHLTHKLRVIGILLDFYKGEVTFYNSQILTPIGTFTGNAFTQTLYPFVAACGTEGPEQWPIELQETPFPKWLSN